MQWLQTTHLTHGSYSLEGASRGLCERRAIQLYHMPGETCIPSCRAHKGVRNVLHALVARSRTPLKRSTRAKSRLELAGPVHLVRMKITHRGALGARLGRTSTLSIGAHLFHSMHTLIRFALSLRRTLLIPIVGAPLIVKEPPPACARVTLTRERGLTATLAATRNSYACARGSPACNAGRALFHRAGVRGFGGERANADRNLSALCFFWRGSGSLSFCRCSLSTA